MPRGGIVYELTHECLVDRSLFVTPLTNVLAWLDFPIRTERYIDIVWRSKFIVVSQNDSN